MLKIKKTADLVEEGTPKSPVYTYIYIEVERDAGTIASVIIILMIIIIIEASHHHHHHHHHRDHQHHHQQHQVTST